MKRIHLFLICSMLAILCVLVMAASFGALSTDHRKPNQNMLGGTGKVSLLNADSTQLNAQYFRDNEKLYYIEYLSADGSAVLYAYSLETGRTEPVCKRIACSHNTPECPLYDLARYDDYSSSIVNQRYCVADSLLYYAVRKDEKLQLWQWEPLSDRRSHITDYPAYQEIRDERGLTTKLNGVLDKVIRLNSAFLAVSCTNVIYIYNNDFCEITQIPIGSANLPFCAVGDSLMWQDYYGCTYCYDLNAEILRSDIFPDMPYAMRESFSYDGVFYFAIDNRIYAYRPDTDSYTEIAQTDISTADTPEPALYGCGAHLYFRSGGIIVRRNLDTGDEKLLPDLPQIPDIETENLLLVRNYHAVDSEQPFLRYDLNGKAVNP